jgi:hypothetical protein
MTFLQNLVDMDSRRRLEVFEEMLLLACQIVLSDFGSIPKLENSAHDGFPIPAQWHFGPQFSSECRG